MKTKQRPEILITERMRLVPADAALVRAEIEGPAALAALLEAEVPDDWPPEEAADALPWFLEQLEGHPERVGWLGWFGLAATRDRPLLVAGAGFLGPPEGGRVEVGYSVLPAFRRRGYGSEMVRALVEWALAHEKVERVVAETDSGNAASLRLLGRISFSQAGAGREPGSIRFERRG